VDIEMDYRKNSRGIGVRFSLKARDDLLTASRSALDSKHLRIEWMLVVLSLR
jgi:hypothetical protein